MPNKPNDISINQGESMGSPLGHSGHSGHRRQIRTGTSGHSEIPLTKGKIAKVDHADMEWLSEFKWSAQKSDKRWYAVRGLKVGDKWTTQAMHRLILDAPSDMDVDHWNGDGLDNRRKNLRLATRAQNMANMDAKGASQVRSGRWAARITRNGETLNLGTFATEAEAVASYQTASRLMDGEFSKYG